MIVTYGGYTHDRDEVAVRSAVTAVYDTFGRQMADVVEYTLLGVLQVPNNVDPLVMQAALTTKLNGLIAAYAVPDQDFAVNLDNGVKSAHFIDSSKTFYGVQVVRPPAFLNGPWTGRIEYLNRRTYTITLRAEFRYGDGTPEAPDLFSYRERILIKGTGSPKWRYSPRQVGTPQAQTLQTITTFYYVQEGESVGRQGFPAPNDPLYPIIEHGEDRVIGYSSPADMSINGNEMFATQWRYVMEATIAQSFTVFVLPGVT